MNHNPPLLSVNYQKYHNQLILAPMVRINSLSFRLLCIKYGASTIVYIGLVYTEELIDKKIISSFITSLSPVLELKDKNKKTFFQTIPQERSRLVLQLGTSCSKSAFEAARIMESYVSGIDVNCGCPKPFSIKGGMGAALLTNVDRLEEILNTLTSGINLPITCKIRLLDNKMDTLKLCVRLQKTNISGITIHGKLDKQGRRRDERYETQADWDTIKLIKQNISIPIVLNGDVLLPQHIAEAKLYTSCYP